MSQQQNASLAELMALLPDSERKALLLEIAPTEKDQKALEYCWPFWARPKQLAPAGDWFTWLILSGRGFGKSRTGAEWVIDRAKNGPYFPIALVGQTKADVRDTMIELGESSILKVSPPWFRPIYEPSKRRLTWPNGVIATVFSGDEPDQLRGPQHGSAWMDELAKFKYPADTWSNLVLGLRLGDKPQAIVTTTPRPIPIIKELMADESTHITTGSTFENMGNLAPSFIREVLKRYEGTRLGQQELYGLVMTDTPGALWTRDTLEATRVKRAPDLVRIVVAVDPGATSSESANQTGIVGAGVDEIDHGYVLTDATCREKPAKWGEKVIRLYDKLGADAVVAETNQGGEMVEHVIRSAAADLHAKGERSSRHVSFKGVHASRGKYTRAEPISALYEQKKVHHVGMFADLEDELTSWVPGEDSPDRLDATVWALSYLMLGAGEPKFVDSPWG